MATRKTAKPKRRSGAQNNAKPKRKPRGKGKPFEPGNPWRIPPGQTLNPGGRPRLLSHAYLEWLGAENEEGIPNAAGIAMALGKRALTGDHLAAKEFRQATEGDKFNFDPTRLTDEQLERIANGEDPRAVLGTASPSGAGAAPAPAGAPGADSGDAGGPLAGPG